MKFKIGDKVKVTSHTVNSTYYSDIGVVGEVCKINDLDSNYPVQIRFTDGTRERHSNGEFESFKEADLTLINTMKNLTESFALALTPEPQKSFRKAGITNGDNILTDEGVKIFLTWVLGKNADAFKKEIVDNLLAEQKAEKCD